MEFDVIFYSKDDGSVTVLKVSSELNYIKYDEVATLKLHAQRVMGVYLDSISEYLYTIGEDKKLIVHDMNKNTKVEGNFIEKK